MSSATRSAPLLKQKIELCRCVTKLPHLQTTSSREMLVCTTSPQQRPCMNKALVRSVFASALVLTGCTGDCTLALAVCGLDISVSGLAAQESVTVSVKAVQEVIPTHSFTCTAQNGICSFFFEGYSPQRVTVQVNRNGVVTSRTLNTRPVQRRAGSCSSCTGAAVDVAL